MMVGGSAAFSIGTTGFGFGGDLLVDLNTHKTFDGAKLLMGGGLEFLAQGVVTAARRLPLRSGPQSARRDGRPRLRPISEWASSSACGRWCRVGTRPP